MTPNEERGSYCVPKLVVLESNQNCLLHTNLGSSQNR
jgi:hypothetical protein